MKHFDFQYTETKTTLKFLGLFFILFSSLFVPLAIITLNIFFSWVITLTLLLLVSFIYRTKLYKKGSATIHDGYAEFRIGEPTHRVTFSSIKSAHTEHYIGTQLLIVFKNGEKFKLQATSYLCNSKEFGSFCSELQKTLKQYNNTTSNKLVIKKSIFELPFILPLLIILTCALVGGITIAVIKGKSIPIIFYIAIFLIIPLWMGHLKVRK